LSGPSSYDRDAAAGSPDKPGDDGMKGTTMLTGGCYCGQVRYEAGGEPGLRGQCFCRECRYVAGGSANLFMIMAADEFAYVAGEPTQFTRPDLESPVTREFCPTCGTHLTTRSPRSPGVILKVGTLDDTAAFAGPNVVLWTDEAEAYHHIPEGVRAFPTFPTRG
jgi:hypothetical protein